MKSNLIFRKIVQALGLDTQKVQEVFANTDIEINDQEMVRLLNDGDESNMGPMPDYVLVLFLNGLVDAFRGKKEGAVALPVTKTTKITNNDVLKKLRIVLNLQEQDLRDALKLVTIELTKSDLSALFRKAGHPHYKVCDDELLMDFIEGFGLLLQSSGKKRTGNVG